ncbi:MAG: sensor histidine kinase [Pseudomonadota bacterium]
MSISRFPRPEVLGLAGVILTLGLIAAVIVSLGRGAGTAINREAVPAALGAAGINSGVEQLSALATRLASAPSDEAVSRLEVAVDQRVVALNGQVAGLSPLVPDWQTDLIRRELSILIAQIEDMAALSQERLALAVREDALSSRLSLLNMQGLGWIEERMAEAAARFSENGPVAEPGATVPEVPGFATVMSYSQLRNLAHRVNEQLRYALENAEGRQLDWVRSDLATSLAAAADLVTALPPDARAGVAPSFEELDALALGETGVLATQAARSALEARVAATARALDQAVARIAGVSAQFEAQAGETVSSQSRALDTYLMGAILGSVGLAVLGLILSGAVLARLRHVPTQADTAALAAALTHLDTGDLAVPIPQKGAGDLAQIAASAERLRVQLQAQAQSSAELGRFAAGAAHDLRAPVTAIGKLSEWITADHAAEMPKEAVEMLGEVTRRCALMQALLDERLASAKGQVHNATPSSERAMLASGTPTNAGAPPQDAPLNPDPALAAEAATEATESAPAAPAPVAESAAQRDLTKIVEEVFDLVRLGDRFTLRVAGEAGLYPHQAPLLRQVLMNLVSNAIRHHDRETGEVLVAADRVTSSAGDQIRLRIVDDGPGIAPIDRARLILNAETPPPLPAADGLPPTEQDGQGGLGLLLVRHIVSEMGGQIDLVSDPEKFRGCAFVILWPAETAAKQRPNQPATAPQPAKLAGRPPADETPPEKPKLNRQVSRAA